MSCGKCIKMAINLFVEVLKCIFIFMCIYLIFFIVCLFVYMYLFVFRRQLGRNQTNENGNVSHMITNENPNTHQNERESNLCVVNDRLNDILDVFANDTNGRSPQNYVKENNNNTNGENERQSTKRRKRRNRRKRNKRKSKNSQTTKATTNENENENESNGFDNVSEMK